MQILEQIGLIWADFRYQHGPVLIAAAQVSCCSVQDMAMQTHLTLGEDAGDWMLLAFRIGRNEAQPMGIGRSPEIAGWHQHQGVCFENPSNWEFGETPVFDPRRKHIKGNCQVS